MSGTEVINSIFTKSLKRLKSPQAADVVWVAEGTCCWEVYAGRKHRVGWTTLHCFILAQGLFIYHVMRR